ncbi:hypothetical protein D3C87_1918730 [compost metagenome]
MKEESYWFPLPIIHVKRMKKEKGCYSKIKQVKIIEVTECLLRYLLMKEKPGRLKN